MELYGNYNQKKVFLLLIYRIGENIGEHAQMSLSNMNQNQALSPYLFSFDARTRGAIGAFYPIVRCIAMPEGLEMDSIEIVSSAPDLEIRGVLLCCKMARGQDFPAPQGPVIAYQLLNDIADGPASLGFIRSSDYGHPLFPVIRERIKSVYRPLVQAWTGNQLIEFAKRNTINWIS